MKYKMFEAQKFDAAEETKMKKFIEKKDLLARFMKTIPDISNEDIVNIYHYFLVDFILAYGKNEEEPCLQFFNDLMKVMKKNIKINLKKDREVEGVENGTNII